MHVSFSLKRLWNKINIVPSLFTCIENLKIKGESNPNAAYTHDTPMSAVMLCYK